MRSEPLCHWPKWDYLKPLRHIVFKKNLQGPKGVDSSVNSNVIGPNEGCEGLRYERVNNPNR